MKLISSSLIAACAMFLYCAAVQAGPSELAAAKTSACQTSLNQCLSQQATLQTSLNSCNSSENTCSNNLTSCLTSLSDSAGGLTSSTETRLLFTFLTSVSGFNTAITISNTSQDPFDTPSQSGSCTLTFYGTGAPKTSSNTGTIAAGATFETVLTSLVSGFSGYMFADCTFGLAHGMAFVQDSTGTKLLSGYQALVVSKTNRVAPEGLNQ